MYQKLIQSQKGMALGVVLIVMTIVSILGAVVLQVSLAETRFVARDENRMQAYYLARSGVEATASWMLNPSNDGAGIIGKTSDPPAKLRDDINGTFTVAVSVESPEELLIEATGVVNGVSARAALILNKAGAEGDSPVFENTIYAEDKIILNGHTYIEGDIAARNEIVDNGNATVLGNLGIDIDITAPPPIFPADPTIDGVNDIEIKDDVTLNNAWDSDQTMVYGTLKLKNATLTIETGSLDNVVNLVVNKLDLQNGTVKIVGEGRLHLFVKKEAVFNSDTNYNAPPTDPADPKQLIIFLNSGCTANLNANRIINGFVYGPGATVTIGGNYGYTGAILAGNVICNGTPGFNYDPDEDDPISYENLPIFYYTRGNWVTE